MERPKARVFYERHKGPVMERENWYSYFVGSNDHYVIHEFDLHDLKGSKSVGQKLYTVDEFLKSDEVQPNPKIKLTELLEQLND